MHILQINKFFHIHDGTSRYFFNVSNLLKAKGHQVSFFSMHHPKNVSSPYSKYFVSNISYRENIFANSLKIISRMLYSLEAREKIKKLLDEIPIDIVHIHSIYHHISPSILVEIKKRNIPIVMTIHDYHLVAPNYLLFHNEKICEITKPDQYYKALFHKCVKNSYIASAVEIVEKYFHRLFGWEKNLIDIFIAPSDFVRNKFIEYNFPKEKIVTVPHFTDIKNYKSSSNPQDYILYFGRLSEEKGLDLLLNVMSNLPQIKCVIVGEGPQESSLKEKIKKEKIQNIQLIGYQNETKLIDLISKARFTVLPSLWYEGFGLTILESNACGKPVIASRIGGIPEAIRDGVNGLLFQSGNIDDCKNKILELWNNPTLSRKMGNNARKFAKKHFNPDLHYKKLMEIYQKAIEISRKILS